MDRPGPFGGLFSLVPCHWRGQVTLAEQGLIFFIGRTLTEGNRVWYHPSAPRIIEPGALMLMWVLTVTELSRERS